MIEKFYSGDECGIITDIYVISNDKNEGVLVDTTYKFDTLYETITKKYDIKAVIITHSHIDHVDGLKFFNKTNIPIYMSKETKEALSDSKASSYYIIGEESPFKENDLNIIVVEDNENLNIIGYDFKFLLTRGHTTGSITIVIDSLKAIFSGDTLFPGRHGMTTYYGGNHKDMLKSIDKILSYPDDYLIYPGHYENVLVKDLKFLKDLNIELFTYGKGFRVDTNVYLVSNGDDAIIFDTSFEFDKVLKIINERYNLKGIFITHSHMDHIDGLKYFIGSDIPIYMSEETERTMYDRNITSYYMINENPPFKKGDLNIIHVKDNDIIDIIGKKVKVISTPGHQKGATSYLISHAIFSGDTIFKGRHAWTTYPTGDETDMKNTLKKLLSYPENYYIYPGHDDLVTVRDSLFLLNE
jgi:glyoxylase-like metal-dependent hydrolase (beta-lactamase superfamily II)